MQSGADQYTHALQPVIRQLQNLGSDSGIVGGIGRLSGHWGRCLLDWAKGSFGCRSERNRAAKATGAGGFKAQRWIAFGELGSSPGECDGAARGLSRSSTKQ